MKNNETNPVSSWKARFFSSENRLTDWLAANIVAATLIAVVLVLVILNLVVPAIASHRHGPTRDAAPASGTTAGEVLPLKSPRSMARILLGGV